MDVPGNQIGASGDRTWTPIVKALREADERGCISEVPGLTGYSGTSVVGALQRIASVQHARGEGDYLEVGVYQGRTLLSVAGAVPGLTAWGVDNFSQFDPGGKNKRTVLDRMRMLGIENARLLDEDYEDALHAEPTDGRPQKVGTYFVDGPHDYRSQLMCLLLARRVLSDQAVIIVDDANYDHVRLATADFLATDPSYRLLFEAYTPCHPGNMDATQRAQAEAGWWNGVNVIVKDSAGSLPAVAPACRRDRSLHVAGHLVHSARGAAAAVEAVHAIQYVKPLRPVRFAVAVARARRRLRAAGPGASPRFDTLNTFSDGLPAARFNVPTGEQLEQAQSGPVHGRNILP